MGPGRRRGPPRSTAAGGRDDAGSEDVCFACGEECQAAALQFAVDGGTGHIEQLGDLGLGVLTAVLDVEQQLSLRHRQLWRLALQVTFRTRHRHPFFRAHADQVAFELGDHGKHVEEQPPHGV